MKLLVTMHSVEIHVLAVLVGLVQSIPVEQFGCESVEYVMARTIVDCLETSGLYKMFRRMAADDEIDKEEFLQELDTTCSDPKMMIEYAECMDGFIADCPELENNITSGMDRQLSLFCENNRPAEWLRNVLQTGYEFNKECITGPDSVFSMISTCVDEDVITKAIQEGTFAEKIDRLQRVLTSIFYCSASRFYEKIQTELKRFECGSTPADVFITSWLVASVMGGPLLNNFGEQEIRVFTAMKSAQLDDLWKHAFFQ